MGNYVNVQTFASKAEVFLKQSDPQTRAILKCSQALAYLDHRKYDEAAKHFIACGPHLGDSFNQVSIN